jgi:hypothetical protein
MVQWFNISEPILLKYLLLMKNLKTLIVDNIDHDILLECN